MEKRKGDRRHVYAGIALSCILLFLTSVPADGSESAGQTAQSRQAAGAAPPSKITAALKEILVWDVANERVRGLFLGGQYAHVQKGKFPAGEYPEFTSDAPLYGQVSFPGAVVGSRRTNSLQFALDCSQKGGNYDLLYFDDNGDGDLTNDKPRKPAPHAQRLGRGNPSLKETYFEPATVTFNFGPGSAQALELLPCLRMYEGNSPQFYFIAARVHTGEFRIDGTSYQAFLGYRYTIRGPLDRSSAGLILVPPGSEPASWWGGDELDATHLLGGHYYRFSCTPAGDKLSVRPYEGPLGVLEAGAGGRNVEKVEIRGSLRSQESAVAVGDVSENGSPRATRQCRIPVGDYYPALIYVDLGDLRLMVSNNYHINAQGQRSLSGPVHGIKIRADKPYVLDLSNKPVVVFTEPAARRQIARGDEVMVKAVLIDPVLDIMIRQLYVTARPPAAISAGREQTTGQPVSLDPKVVVKRSNGEIVAEGVMPFG
jgi:hypothetical protein